MQSELFKEPDKQKGIPYNVAEWICASCGASMMNPMYKGCRGLEARHWMVVHYSTWDDGMVWKTARFCKECGAKAIERLLDS